MKFRFKPTSTAQTVDIQNGEYSRRFERAAEPFDVTEREAGMLRGVDDLEPIPEASEPQNEEQQQSQSGEQNSHIYESTGEGEPQQDTSSADPAARKNTRRRASASQTS